MRYGVLDLFKYGVFGDLNKEFKSEALLNDFGVANDVKKNKKTIIYKYDYLEITFLGNRAYSLLIDELNYGYETNNSTIYNLVKPLLSIKISGFKNLLNINRIRWHIDKENTFSDQVCIETQSKCKIYFNANDLVIRSVLFKWE